MENNTYKPNRFYQFIKEVLLMILLSIFFSSVATSMVASMASKYVNISADTRFALLVSIVVVIFLVIFVTAKHVNRIIIENNRIKIKLAGGQEEEYNFKDHIISHSFTISRYSRSIREKRLIVVNNYTQMKQEYDCTAFSNADFEEILNITQRSGTRSLPASDTISEDARIYRQVFLVESTLNHDFIKSRLRFNYIKICFLTVCSILINAFVFDFYFQAARLYQLTVFDILVNEGVLWLIIVEAGLLSYLVKQNLYKRKRIKIDQKMVPERIIVDVTEMTINNLVIPYNEIVKIQVTPVDYQKPYEISITTNNKQYRCIFEECRPSYKELINSLSTALKENSKTLELKILSSIR